FYKRYKHGEAIAIGMVSAACIGETMGDTPTHVSADIQMACYTMGLPTALPTDIPDDALIALLARDKKAENGAARFVLARALGDVQTGVAVDEATIRAGLTLHRTRYPARK
ncbi:MAG: hypothetical protein H7Y38_03030, partial [Armatimonadetes bacterium]|nr:hypothetical protein [Armatimonadota bacterium]